MITYGKRSQNGFKLFSLYSHFIKLVFLLSLSLSRVSLSHGNWWCSGCGGWWLGWIGWDRGRVDWDRLGWLESGWLGLSLGWLGLRLGWGGWVVSRLWWVEVGFRLGWGGWVKTSWGGLSQGGWGWGWVGVGGLWVDWGG